MSAISPRVETQKAGLAAMPGFMAPTSYAGLQDAYNTADERRQREVGGMQRLFGSLTETSQASSRGG
jgi:hypothetical protein